MFMFAEVDDVCHPFPIYADGFPLGNIDFSPSDFAMWLQIYKHNY